MNRLRGKQILLGITGGIAAYKGAELVRSLRKEGAKVRVVMTDAAQEFITPLTLQALSGLPVHTSLLDPAAEAAMGHIELARWADLVLVAPASADFLARLAQGRGDDLLTTLCLATPAPIAVAPAMNQGMWRSNATQDNIRLLVARGVRVLGPGSGEQACGDNGLGRMLEVPALISETVDGFSSQALAGRKVVVTAGPTREPLDPVRFLSNHSSGKMGFAMAAAAWEAGAEVILITGPVHLETPPGVTRVDVVTAEDMLAAALESSTDCDIFVGTAAVADYRPAWKSPQKIKKSAEQLQMDLVRNPDIIATIARLDPAPFMVGFAAETEHLLDHARKKIVDKKLDLICVNDVSQGHIGFNSDQNEITLVHAEGHEKLPLTTKTTLARLVMEQLTTLYLEQQRAK